MLLKIFIGKMLMPMMGLVVGNNWKSSWLVGLSPYLQLENRCIKKLWIFSEILLVLYLFKGFILMWFVFQN
jgi:hypothetical protein